MDSRFYSITIRSPLRLPGRAVVFLGVVGGGLVGGGLVGGRVVDLRVVGLFVGFGFVPTAYECLLKGGRKPTE